MLSTPSDSLDKDECLSFSTVLSGNIFGIKSYISVYISFHEVGEVLVRISVHNADISDNIFRLLPS